GSPLAYHAEGSRSPPLSCHLSLVATKTGELPPWAEDPMASSYWGLRRAQSVRHGRVSRGPRRGQPAARPGGSCFAVRQSGRLLVLVQAVLYVSAHWRSTQGGEYFRYRRYISL